MENQFKRIMTERTDAELLQIVTRDRNDYQPDALEAAERELKTRNLTQDQREKVEQEVKRIQTSINDRKNTPLGIGLKCLTFLLPGLVNLFLAKAFEYEGYERKGKEMLHWTWYGVGFYGIVAMLALWRIL